jgi:hypothetical protein
MKVVKYFEVALEDRDEMAEKWGKYLEKSAKSPDKYPRYIFGPSGHAKAGESIEGVSIMEIDNEEQLINYMLELSPPLKANFVILYDVGKYTELYMKTKQ